MTLLDGGVDHELGRKVSGRNCYSEDDSMN